MFFPRPPLPSRKERRLAWVTVCVALMLVALAISAFAAGDGVGALPAIPSEALVLRPVGGGGRSPFLRDALVAQMVAGKWTAPNAGDSVDLPDGGSRKWEKVEVAKDGAFPQHAALAGGYAYVAVPAEREQVMVLEASGHLMVYVNGEPRTGDFYAHGYVKVPVLLHKGTNDLLFQCGRGTLRAKLVEPKAAALFNTADNTLPSLIVGRKTQSWAATVVLNATAEPLSGLVVEATLPGGEPVRTPVPSLPPLSVRKVVFRLEGPAPQADGDAVLQIALLRKTADKEQTLDSAKLTLGVRKPEALQVRTFRSDIDGSVQYYALVPAKAAAEGTPPARPGLVLTLHGAAVEGQGQAACYAPKRWAHVVAPTNRRPYGFDWEDWGRLDALEVLERARKDLDTDPRRTWLTGHSMGGHGTWHLGVTYPDRFAAIAPSAGWISMFSYAGARRPVNPNAIQEMFLRASSPSDTLALQRNYQQYGVYILHGEKDDNVLVGEARTMKEHLEKFHKDLAYHEEPGAGHWWGNACVDYPALGEFLEKHTIPERKDVPEVEFVTASPGVSAWSQWAGIEAQLHELQPSSVHIRWDKEKNEFHGTTENVARLALDLQHLEPATSLTVDLDGQKLEKVAWPQKPRRLWLARNDGNWAVIPAPAAALKGPDRYGPFREAFRNHMVFVYGTKGSAEENAWALAKARYDAESFWYRGNGSIDVLGDKEFDPAAERDRNVILYGNADSTAAWKALLGDSPVQVRGGVVRVGDREEKGDELACLFVRPRPGSDRALVGVVTGSGVTGMRLTDRLPYFVSGVGYPDCVVFGPEVLSKGTTAVRGAGFFGMDWTVEKGEFAWGK
jgi:predicted esterase